MSMKKKVSVFVLLSFIFGLTGAVASTLDVVKKRGYLICGVSTGALGLSAIDKNGVWQGIDAEGCRAVAAAVFGNKDKVKFVPTTTRNRFAVLQSGQVDVLFRGNTLTLSRDTKLGFDFPVINWYDGQGFLVNRSLGVKSAKGLNGVAICIQPGTTAEKNIAEYFLSHNMVYEPIVIERQTEAQKTLKAGRCDVYSTDKTGLTGMRASMPDPKNWIILPETISKEPLGPVVRQGDSKWADVVRWTVNVLIAGEEFGVTSNNVNQERHSKNQEVLRLLGVKGQLGSYLGLSKDFGYNIIKQVGNYKQIYKRTLGAVGLPRGLNKLWTQGGLLYAPPFR